eukprot:scpid108806/ scgid7991/ 
MGTQDVASLLAQHVKCDCLSLTCTTSTVVCKLEKQMSTCFSYVSASRHSTPLTTHHNLRANVCNPPYRRTCGTSLNTGEEFTMYRPLAWSCHSNLNRVHADIHVPIHTTTTVRTLRTMCYRSERAYTHRSTIRHPVKRDQASSSLN